MNMSHLPLTQNTLSVTEVYTNLHGLQGLKVEANKDQALKKVAQQFEAMFLNMMLKSMRSANEVFSEDSLFDNKETETWNEMLDQQRALSLAHKNGIGIADAMYRQLSRQVAPTASNPGSEVENILHDLPARQPTQKNLSLPDSSANPAPLSRSPALPQEKQQIAAEAAEVRSSKADNAQRIAFAESPADYVRKVMPHAKKAGEKLGVDPCILVAQSALETGWGKYVLSNEKGESSHNLFNIKATSSWQDKKVMHQTLEFNNGVVYRESAEFRAYDSIQRSFEDYAVFISENGRYKQALQKAADSSDYIRELQSAGYATDPDYAQKVLAVATQVDHYLSQQRGSLEQPAATSTVVSSTL